MYFPAEIFRLIKEYLFVYYNDMRNMFGSICISIIDQTLYQATETTSIWNDYRRDKILSVSNRNSGYFKYLSHSKFMETHKMTQKADKIISFVLNYGSPSDDIYYFKNLRFEDESIIKYIKNIKFINNDAFENFNGCFYKTLQKFYKMKGIPIYIFKYGYLQKFHTYGELIIQFNEIPKEDISIIYDVYQRPVYYSNHQFFTYQCLRSSTHAIKPKNNIVTLKGFHHPTYFFMCNHRLTNIILDLFGKKYHLEQHGQIIRLTNEINSDILSNYPFNMSRTIPYSFITFDSPDSNKIIISCVNLNLLHSIKGYYYMGYL